MRQKFYAMAFHHTNAIDGLGIELRTWSNDLHASARASLISISLLLHVQVAILDTSGRSEIETSVIQIPNIESELRRHCTKTANSLKKTKYISLSTPNPTTRDRPNHHLNFPWYHDSEARLPRSPDLDPSYSSSTSSSTSSSPSSSSSSSSPSSSSPSSSSSYSSLSSSSSSSCSVTVSGS